MDPEYYKKYIEENGKTKKNHLYNFHAPIYSMKDKGNLNWNLSNLSSILFRKHPDAGISQGIPYLMRLKWKNDSHVSAYTFRNIISTSHECRTKRERKQRKDSFDGCNGHERPETSLPPAVTNIENLTLLERFGIFCQRPRSEI